MRLSSSLFKFCTINCESTTWIPSTRPFDILFHAGMLGTKVSVHGGGPRCRVVTNATDRPRVPKVLAFMLA